jgi:hypothetical protein
VVSIVIAAKAVLSIMRFDTFAEGSIDRHLPWPAMRGRGETAP